MTTTWSNSPPRTRPRSARATPSSSSCARATRSTSSTRSATSPRSAASSAPPPTPSRCSSPKPLSAAASSAWSTAAHRWASNPRPTAPTGTGSCAPSATNSESLDLGIRDIGQCRHRPPGPNVEAVNTASENVASTVDQAVHKAEELRSPGRFLVSAMLAGAYIAVGEVLLLVAISPFVAEHSASVKLLEGAVFPIALTLVMFAGAQLFTSTVMTMLVGALSGRTGVKDMLIAWAATLFGNFVGTLAFAAMVHASGVTSSPTAKHMLAELLSGKNALAGGQLFWRAVLCNMLVCLAVWMFSRVRTPGAKIALLWMPVLVFVSAGFEHCVANMSLYTIGILEGQATFTDLARNLLYTVPGNIIGGGLLVGAVYWYTSGAHRARPAHVPTPAGQGIHCLVPGA
ncbi:hypothetical protein GL303_32190 [Nocardia seriolae]|nr:hypothetical protein [Nocardia seriolae]MTJ72743.1 hypothetical protein [Nocardia seriolae]MTK51062.1 hypothetical protein [Nocardia seriolae]MTL16032.1 hypothetical protein [Nocardia seriolae]